MLGRTLQGILYRAGTENLKVLVRKISCTRCSNIASKEIRNIGIMAHIDAGKTTTTERMLFYSGFINRMGDIDAGTTVMDYLESERSRGITVQSAAISFKWNDCAINLIDTPGHVDFTIEVERSLRVLDGAVAVFDASRGVEAQSRTVWKQANRNHVPRIVFLNKMDKHGASFVDSVKSIVEQLDAKTLILQLPHFDKGEFSGVADIVTMETIVWGKDYGHTSGREFSRKNIDEKYYQWEDCMKVRENIIEQLAEIYDEVAGMWLDGPLAGDVASFPAEELNKWIRRATIDNHAVPVLCGTSFRNIGVQPLLDAVVKYLPRPTDIVHDFMKYYDGKLVAMAFKIIHDKKYGTLIFVRVYSGKLKNKSDIFNPNKSTSETVSRLLAVYADEYEEVSEIASGSIGIVCGLKHTVTGDTLLESEESYNEACSKAEVGDDLNEEERTSSPAVLTNVPVPEPVFFRSILADSMKYEEPLEKALELISREDPSIQVKPQEHGGFLLCGMGELHLDIVADRIQKEMRVKVLVGEVQVAYRETPTLQAEAGESIERSIAGKNYAVSVAVEVDPLSQHRCFYDVKPVRNSGIVSEKIIQSAALGIHQECQRGSLYGFPIIGCRMILRSVEVKKGCPPALITSAASKCTRRALQEAQCQLIEPITDVEVTTTLSQVQPILNELTKRHATIKNISQRNNVKSISAQAALAEIKDFASALRSVTSGNADLHLQISGYQQVSPEREHKIKSKLSGGNFYT